MKKSFLGALFIALTQIIGAQDWASIPIPANPPSGMKWELNPVSDSFNYQSSSTNLHPEFTQRWNELYINGFSGPSATFYHKDHTWISNGHLNIHGAWDQNQPIIYTGCISSKKPLSYPMFMEARVKQANCMLANNIWMISKDETEELDMLESYPNSQTGREWFDQRIHLSHHTFIRNPLQDYQPRDEEGVFGTWYQEEDRESWRTDYFTIGVYWINPHHAEYYINGNLVRTIKSNEHSFIDPQGNLSEHTTTFDAIDKYGYTGGTGLSKPQHIIINMEQQSWLSDANIYPTRDDLNDANNRNLFSVDWIRVYDAVPTGGRIPVTGVTINHHTVIIRPGETFDLTYDIAPANATSKIVTWNVSNKSIAKINGLGQVTGLKQGTVGATITTFDGDFTDIVTVRVEGEPIAPIDENIAVDAVSILPRGGELEVGQSTSFNAGIIPFNATIQTVLWSSSNINVATVSTLGEVLAIGEGTATITARTLEGDKTDAVTISVINNGINDPDPDPISVTGINTTPSTATLNIGQTQNLTAAISPTNASNTSINWTSSNSNVASVNSSGIVTAITAGTTTITATTVDGSYTDTSIITVENNNNIPDPTGDTIVIEAESFNNTEGTFNDASAGGPGQGVNISGTIINYVNAGDFTEYTINVGTAGDYEISYEISTPVNNAAIEIEIDGIAINTNVPNNGSWNNPTTLSGSDTISLTPGVKTVTITASGSNPWQWNLDKIILERIVTNTPPASPFVIEAEDFNSTGGTFNDGFAGGPGLGANATATAINYVNSGDFTMYTIDLTTGGNFDIEYLISTPVNNAEIQMLVDGILVDTTTVPNNGGWDNYSPLSGGNISLSAGSHTIRINASGSNTWQWNLDKINFTPNTGAKSIEIVNEIPRLGIIPNPASNTTYIMGLKPNVIYSYTLYDLQGTLITSNAINSNKNSIDISIYANGVYFINIESGTSQKVLKLIINN